MDPQRYIVNAIELEMNVVGRLPWLKFISETSMLPVEDYPALLVEDENPYGTADMLGDGVMMTRTGDYMMSLIIKMPNLKDMTRADYRIAKDEIVNRIEEIELFLIEKWQENATLTEDGVTVSIFGLSFGKANLDFIEIESQPALILGMLVETKYIIN